MGQIHVHRLIAETARELCLVTYENVMSHNEVRKQWKEAHPGASELGLQSAFVKKYLSGHLAAAKTTLAGMLGQPIDEKLKQTIHDALVKDASLTRGRGVIHG